MKLQYAQKATDAHNIKKKKKRVKVYNKIYSLEEGHKHIIPISTVDYHILVTKFKNQSTHALQH